MKLIVKVLQIQVLLIQVLLIQVLLILVHQTVDLINSNVMMEDVFLNILNVMVKYNV